MTNGKNFKMSFAAKIVSIRHTKLQNLTDYVCFLDTGYCKADTINIIKTMYKNKPVDVNTVDFSVITLKKL